MNILWLDDDENVFKSASKVIQSSLDINFDGITQLEELKSKLNSNNYDAVFLDLDLGNPEINGIDVYEEVLKLHPEMPVGFVSAHLAHPMWYEEIEMLQKVKSNDLIFTLPIPFPSKRSPEYVTHVVNPIQSFIEQIRIQETNSALHSNVAYVQKAIERVNKGYIEYVSEDLSRLETITPRQFEYLTAELFEKEGFQVSVTKQTRDGGKDIYATKIDDLTNTLYAVECKKYTFPNKVNVDDVRKLNGVVEAENLSGGVIATTSYFTKDAIQFAQLVKNRLFLSNIDDIKTLINKHGNR